MSKTSSCGVRTPLSPLAQATIDKHLPNLSLKRGLQSIHQSQNFGTKTDASCLTDICNGDNLPEIEICSLLEEKIPKYRVRLDVLTNFTGYSNHDWFVPVPALHIPDGGLGLTKNQTRETLNYFLLCGNRVSQMTRAYDDIEAVTRLLEEKEKDLELTIQIGKELLAQNVALESRIADLEINVKTLNEDRAQLLHEMQKKAQLISILTNDIDDNSENDTPTFSKSVTLDLLQKKISSLQDENKSLKIEASQIVHQTDEVEEQERKLMEDITMQLNVTNSQFDYLNLELERQKEENRVQHEQIVNLTSQYTETQMRLNNLIQENEEQSTLLNITKENQNSLALELVEFKTRYEEVLSLLQEAQEQLRKQRKKAQPQIRSSFISSLGIFPSESLHSELMESSLYSENSIDSGFSGDRIYERIGGISSNNFEFGPHKKTFEMLRYTTLNKNCNNHLASVISSCNYSGPRISAMQYTNNSRLDKINVENVHSDVQTQREVLASNSDDLYPSQPSGIPGTPGAKDLEAALRRLTTGEVLARRAMLSYAPVGTYTYEDNSAILPIGSRTPDSMISTESSGVVEPSNIQSHNYWRFPEKLQIVKPIEGSQTLHHWSKLATPTLSGLLEDRPGVTIRGGRGLNELGMQIYSLSDVEEDIDSLPGKQFEAAGCIYTFTTSTVLHPDDGISSDLSFLSKSQMSSRLASVSTSRQPSCPQTPNTGLSRRNSCSTFSIYMGLASVLNERGIKAVTPSALSTPTGQNYSPTSTPCNSPESSPPRTPPPDSLFSFLSLGAEKIRKKISCEEIKRGQSKQQKIILSRLEKRSLRSLKLVEKVERIGLENIIATKTNAVFHLGNGIASRSASPTIYLPNSKHNESSNVTDGSIQFNRDQIKCVLSKGLASTQNLQDKNVPEENTSFSLTLHDPQPESCLRKEKNSLQTTSRSKQIQRQKTRRTVKNGTAVQRQDLGTIDARVRPNLGSVISAGRDYPTTLTGSNEVDLNIEKKAYVKQSVVGSISSLLFGRKGGWL